MPRDCLCCTLLLAAFGDRQGRFRLALRRNIFPTKGALEERLAKLSRSENTISDQVVTDLVEEVTHKIVSLRRGAGLLLILDEVGKFLEYAAQHPDRQDGLSRPTFVSGATRLAKYGVNRRGNGAGSAGFPAKHRVILTADYVSVTTSTISGVFVSPSTQNASTKRGAKRRAPNELPRSLS